jgi:hypothetical protein
MDQTDDIQKVKEYLMTLGAQPEDLEDIINDVNGVVVERTVQDYLSKIENPETRTRIEKMQGEELIEYVKTHPDEFPSISEERFKEITQETWQEYFEFMENEASL